MSRPANVPPAWRAASRPLFWVALALLALNDHVLKGAGVLPGELTGKLSDFAGLVVAPIVLAALVGARSLGSRALCLLAVGAGFSVINLFPPVALAVEGAIPWSITVDPSDLVALPALGAAWWLMADTSERTRMALTRIGIAVGAVACMATSYADEAGTCSRDGDCESGWICCDSLCVDPDWHSDYCGGCGIQCSSVAICNEGTCERDGSTEADLGLDFQMSLPEGVAVEPPQALEVDPLSPRAAEMSLAR